MKARPILFTSSMIRALIEGWKTQTRRVLKPQPTWIESKYTGGHWMIEGHEGRGENRRCVLSTSFDPVEYARTEHGAWFAGSGCPYGQPGDLLWVRETFANLGALYPGYEPTYVPREGWPNKSPATVIDRWKPGIHMPRAASRLTLRITEVRVQRLKDIDGLDAIAEGITRVEGEAPWRTYKHLWGSINGPGSWDANPWVWCLTFETIKKNVDDVLREAA